MKKEINPPFLPVVSKDTNFSGIGYCTLPDLVGNFFIIYYT